MAKFVLTYTGGGPMSDSAEEREKVMSAWMGWFGSLGAAVVDGGNPFGAASTVTASGVSSDNASGTNGYSILHAPDMAAAVTMAQGCPILAAGGAVEVHEALSM